MHGLGGSASQFAPLLTSLVNLAPCMAIDLPGCGLSDFAPNDPRAYTTRAFAELLCAAITRFRNTQSNQKVILIGHSMGCSINALLASSTSPISHLLDKLVIGMVAVCPRGALPTTRETTAVRRMTSLPVPLFDLLRIIDRRGGLFSKSVSRVVGKDADEHTRRKQLTYNEQSESAPFLRIMRAGMGPDGMPGKDVWSGIKVPLFLVAGDGDTITPAHEVERISSWLTTSSDDAEAGELEGPDTIAPAVPMTAGGTSAVNKREKSNQQTKTPPRTDSGNVIKDEHTSSKHAFALKTTIFPEPAAHGLLYSSSTVRILSGMIENFLSHHVDERLGAGWQLSHMSTSGKWDVKNLKKWQSVEPCSAPIGGLFRAMKTMREVDEQHCPKEFVKHYSSAVIPDGVVAIVDISHESPVYHYQGLEDAGVEYHKFPTVSKEKPRAEEVDHFIALVDRLRQSPNLGLNIPLGESKPRPTIGVHCHYGFNRTGFLIVCYLVERAGYKLQNAIDEFAEKRPPGIKHDHFVNELYVRYAVKMERRNTFVENE